MTENDSWISQASTYTPEDRHLALFHHIELPENMIGAVLFADISGFTPLTEALTDELGLRRGAEELPRYLNMIYDALIDEVEKFGGSVISFAGDAITCWFSQTCFPYQKNTKETTALESSKAVLRAASCAFAMQDVMKSFAEIKIQGRDPIALSVKVAISFGAVRRFLVGNPDIMLYDVMAGRTLYRMAEGEHHANRGEVLMDEFAADFISGEIEISEWRGGKEGEGRGFAVVSALKQAEPIENALQIPLVQLGEDQVKSWVHQPVLERLRAGMGEFLTELRPTVPLFLRFSGIDYDEDPDAGQKLNAYIQAVQAVIRKEGGNLLEITVGDKGSYLYISFGACISHEDDARRAVLAARQLSQLHTGLGEEAEIQIGITRGMMRTGEYGGKTRRSYGALGDDVNLAARLMSRAAPGEILVSRRVHKELTETAAAKGSYSSDGIILEPREPIPLKGKVEPIAVFAVTGLQQRRVMRLQEPVYGLAMVGRQEELQHIAQSVDLVLQQKGQVIGITAEPGMGKSRLVSESIRLCRTQGLEGYGGACQSDGTQTPYLVWKPIWSALFDIDPEAPLRRQVRNLEGEVEDFAPERLDSLPLLGELLGLSIPDNDFTRALEPKHRCTALEALLLDYLKGRAKEAEAEGNGILLVLEDIHWIDAVSRDLLERVLRAIADLPVLVILAYRPHESAGDLATTSGSTGIETVFNSLSYFTCLRLQDLSPQQIEQAIRAKLAQLYPEWRGVIPRLLIDRVITQAQGNPFYAEELLNYLHDRDLDLRDEKILEKVDLPSSLNSLIISRLDQLTASEQFTIKVASILGRVFHFEHLQGYYPELGDQGKVKTDLGNLAALDLTPLDPAEPELAYLFKHLITHSVAYESLPVSSRSRLHERYANYLESKAGEETEKVLDQLAFHYSRSENREKKSEYLVKAGMAAQRRYANTAAIGYFQDALGVVESAEKPGVLLRLGQVQELLGQWDKALVSYTDSMQAAEQQGQTLDQAHCQAALAELARKRGKYAEAEEWLAKAYVLFEGLGNQDGIAQVLHFKGTVATHQGDFKTAESFYKESLEIRKAQGDHAREASLLSNLAILARLGGDLDRSVALNQEALALRRELGDKWAIAVSLNNLGNVSTDQGKFEQARQYHEEGLALRREVGDMWVVANSLNNLGNLARDQKDFDLAMSRYRESLVIVKEYNDRWAAAYLLEDIACLAELRGQAESALQLMGAAEALRQTLGAPRSPAEQQKLQVNLDKAKEKLGPAADEFLEAGRQMELGKALAFAVAL